VARTPTFPAIRARLRRLGPAHALASAVVAAALFATTRVSAQDAVVAETPRPRPPDARAATVDAAQVPATEAVPEAVDTDDDAGADDPPEEGEGGVPELPGDDAETVTTATAAETDEEAARIADEDDERPRVASMPTPEAAASPAASSPELVLYGFVHGEWELRFDALSAIPLPPLPGQPDTDSLGQQLYASQWFRLRGEFGLRPHLRLVVHADLLRGVLFGDTAQGIAPSAWRRDRRIGFDGDAGCAREARCERQSAGFLLRQFYLAWNTRAGELRVGQQGFHWGLGIAANDGDQRPFFGDTQFGDLVERVSFVGRPLGPRHPLSIGVAADVVFDEGPFDLRRGDVLAQGVASVLWQRGEGAPITAAAGGTRTTVIGRERALGTFLAVRSGTDRSGARLDLATIDVYARWDVREPGGGRVFAAFEGAYTFGSTELALSPTRTRERVVQLVGAAQLGRSSDHLDVLLELGHASGDARANDGVQSRGVFDGDHRVGLLLFPEVLNWLTARAVASALPMAGDDARALALVPSSGGVAGATYLAPTILWRPEAWIELRLGAVVARTSGPQIDLVAERLGLGRRNWRGGDASQRDLGLELDAALLLSTELRDRVTLTGGLEGGVLFAGRALDDAFGVPLGDISLVRARVGLRF
jgi:hypothetical protein